MDQGPASLPKRLSTPKILGPQDRDSVDDRTVTIWGTADSEVTVELWDWLFPAARTVTDSDGHWSVTLNDLESGEHLYYAQAAREPDVSSDRSDSIVVRVRPSPEQRQHHPARTVGRRWKLPRTGIARMLHRRSPAKSAERGEGLFREQEREELRTAPQGAIAMERPPLDEPALPLREDAGEDESAPPTSTVQSELEAPDETSADVPLIELEMTMVEDKQEAIEIEVETLLKASTPLDLGVAEEVMIALPVHDVLAERVIPSAVPRRLWAQRIAGDRRPTYVITNRVIPPDTAYYLGTATLVSPPAVDDGPQPNQFRVNESAHTLRNR